MHEGIDLVAPRGAPIYAAETGEVIHAAWIRGYGNTVIIKHDAEWSTFYAHLNSFAVIKGEMVGRGQEIGGMGRTGRVTATHLHFEIRKGADPLDPILFLPQLNLKRDKKKPKFYVPSVYGQ